MSKQLYYNLALSAVFILASLNSLSAQRVDMPFYYSQNEYSTYPAHVNIDEAFSIASALFDGKQGLKQDEEAASLLLKTATEALMEYVKKSGDVEEAISIASTLLDGNQGLRQEEEAANLLLKTASEALVEYVKESGDAREFTRLLAKARDEYGAGHNSLGAAYLQPTLYAINLLAYCYANGESVNKDYSKAHKTIDIIINTSYLSGEIRGNAYDSKGEFYLMEGDKDNAKLMLDKALELCPQIAEAKTVLFQAFNP